MTVVPLKCPNCGAMVSRETMKCQYCGASLILTEDGSTLLSRKRIVCPKCGSTMAEGSWFCRVCGEIITKDVNHLKQIQKKIRFQQESSRNDIPEICDKIEPDEFICFLFRYKGLLANKYFVATDKKLIKYELFGQYWEAPWSEVVSIGNPEFESFPSLGTHRNSFKVQTFNETVTFDFGENSCWQFHTAVHQALNDYTLQKKDIRALICSLKFEDEEQ
jgi:ribosomal protein S27AE